MKLISIVRWPVIVFAAVALSVSVAQAQLVTEFSAGITAGAGPSSITAGPDGNVWFTEILGGRIGRITPGGVVTEFGAGLSAGAHPASIAAGPDGNLWFTETTGNHIGRITPGGVVTEFSSGITASTASIAPGPDGNLWFTELTADRIGRITPAGVVTEFSAGITSGATLRRITAGADGNLWFVERDGNRIGRITPAGVITEFGAGISAGATPAGIAAGPDDNLWFTELNGNRIGRITPAGVVMEFSAGISAGAGPNGITAGPDGNLWFAESSDRIGRITPAGVVTEFSTGIAAGAGPNSITADSSGNLWFTEYSGNRIGRITTGASAPSGVLLVAPYGNPPLITAYADGASGNAPPLRVVQGASTQLYDQATAIAADSVHHEFWVASSMHLSAFAILADGDQQPLRVISSGDLSVAQGVALDLAHDEVVVGSYDNGTADAVLTFPRTGHGVLTPLRRIAGPATGIAAIYGVAVDPVANEIYAAVNQPAPAILVFSRTANGNVAPLRRIAGGRTLVSRPFAIAVDPAHGELAIADFDNHAIRFFSRSANGNVAPLRSIAGGNTGLRDVRGIALLGDFEVLAANGGPAPADNAVLAFPRTGNGNIAPSRVLAGPATRLLANMGIAVYHPSLLLSGGRFAVEATWKKPTGDVGGGSPTQLTADTGDFWFFSSSNLEAVVKVLNGCGTNGHIWFFAGGLTNVLTSLKVTDLQTGAIKTYDNPQNTAFQPIQDTAAFATCGAADVAAAPALVEPAGIEGAPDDREAEQWETAADPLVGAWIGVASCSGLCLGNGRFQVTAHWATGAQSGAATGVGLTPDTGYLWFFNSSNVEAVVKVLNGCGLNGRYWVFAGGLTNVLVDLTITDTAHGTSKTYHNPQGTAFRPIQDTVAFATCP